MATWWNWQTRDTQNVEPQGMGVRISPLGPQEKKKGTKVKYVLLLVLVLMPMYSYAGCDELKAANHAKKIQEKTGNTGMLRPLHWWCYRPTKHSEHVERSFSTVV